MSSSDIDLTDVVDHTLSEWPAVQGYVAIRRSALSLSDRSRDIWLSTWTSELLADTLSIYRAKVVHDADEAMSMLRAMLGPNRQDTYVLLPVSCLQNSRTLGPNSRTFGPSVNWGGLLQADIDAWPGLQEHYKRETCQHKQPDLYVRYDGIRVAEGDWLSIDLSPSKERSARCTTSNTCRGGYCMDAAAGLVYFPALHVRTHLRAATLVRRTGCRPAWYVQSNQNLHEGSPYRTLHELKNQIW